jgi:DNA (cytosine-5)-methyltransferase 1
LGYDAEWQVCNSKHFGVPQNRERVFIIGHFRGGGCTEQIFPLQTSDSTTNELRRHGVVSNTLDTRIEATTRGTYPIDGGGCLKVNGYHRRKRE